MNLSIQPVYEFNREEFEVRRWYLTNADGSLSRLTGRLTSPPIPPCEQLNPGLPAPRVNTPGLTPPVCDAANALNAQLCFDGSSSAAMQTSPCFTHVHTSQVQQTWKVFADVMLVPSSRVSRQIEGFSCSARKSSCPSKGQPPALQNVAF